MSRMLDIDNCALVVIDLQGKLAQLMHDKDNLFKNTAILVRSANILDIPIIWCQQVPKALGPTIPEIADLLEGVEPINKASFSCDGDDSFKEKLFALGKKQILLTGIEAHICVYQTARNLQIKGYEPTVIADAVSSRTMENKHIALNRLAHESIAVSSTEMTIFELLKTAKHPNFREIAKLVK